MIVTGSPGGSRIITAVLQVLINVIDHRMPIADAVAAPRVHHQWLPDEVVVERGVPAASQGAGGARPQGRGRGRRAPRRTRSWSRRRAWSARPTPAPAARWRPDTS